MYETRTNTEMQNIAYKPSDEFKASLISYAIQGLFEIGKEEPEEQEPDLFEAMENFLNEPYNQQQEEEKPSAVADFVTGLLVKGVINYLKPQDV